MSRMSEAHFQSLNTPPFTDMAGYSHEERIDNSDPEPGSHTHSVAMLERKAARIRARQSTSEQSTPADMTSKERAYLARYVAEFRRQICAYADMWRDATDNREVMQSLHREAAIGADCRKALGERAQNRLWTLAVSIAYADQ